MCGGRKEVEGLADHLLTRSGRRKGKLTAGSKGFSCSLPGPASCLWENDLKSARGPMLMQCLPTDLSYQTLPLIATAGFTTQALLVQSPPIIIRIVDGKFGPRLNAFTREQDLLLFAPHKALKLGIRLAAVVDESREVSSPPVPYLALRLLSSLCTRCAFTVRGRHLQRPRLALHHVNISQSLGDNSHKLADAHPPLERTQRQRLPRTIQNPRMPRQGQASGVWLA